MPQPDFGNLISKYLDPTPCPFASCERHAQTDPHHTPLRRRVCPPWPPPAARRRLSPRPAPIATAQPQRRPARAALGLVAVSIARCSRAHRRLRAGSCRMLLCRRRRALPPSPATLTVRTCGTASAGAVPLPIDASKPGRQPAATADQRGYCRANQRRGQVRRPRLAPSAAAAAIAQAAADRVGLAAAAARIEAPAQASHARLRVLPQTDGVEAPPRRTSNSRTDRLARSKVSDAGDRYRLCAVRWPKTPRRLVPQCCCCGSRQRHDQPRRRGAAAHRARSAALPHRRRPGRSERRRRAARDALSVTPACAAAARRLLHC